MRPRNLRIVSVDENDILIAVVAGPKKLPLMFTFSRIQSVPDDAAIVSVHYDWCRRAFDFVVYHESFSPIPDGAAIQRIHPDANETLVRLDIDVLATGGSDA